MAMSAGTMCERSPGPDPLADAMRRITDIVRTHTPEDRELFRQMFNLMLATDDPEERDEALRTMMEIVRDHDDPTATIAALRLDTTDAAPDSPKLKAWNDHVAARLRKLRHRREWTQEQLAEASGLAQSHISRIEKGIHSPSWKTLVRLARALGVDVGEIDPANADQPPAPPRTD